jgi:hypothetical protein
MSRFSFSHCLILAGLALGMSFSPARSNASSGRPTAVMVDEFSYLDTSGEPSNQDAIHRTRLQSFMAALRQDVAADPHLRAVGTPCEIPCATDGRSVNASLRTASEAGAMILIVGSVQKTSTLVQWARAAAIDVTSNRIVFEKLFTFRGDNDEAWQQAEAFISRDIRDALAAPPSRPRLAVFPFELEDESASAGLIGESESDSKGLADATDAVRQLLKQSGRYRVIEADAAAAAMHPLHECSDCAERLAREMEADRSLIGVVRRISRAEYTVRFQVRDAGTGAVIVAGDSGLRMGANYSWGRGALRLIQDRLLDGAVAKP